MATIPVERAGGPGLKFRWTGLPSTSTSARSRSISVEVKKEKERTLKFLRTDTNIIRWSQQLLTAVDISSTKIESAFEADPQVSKFIEACHSPGRL